MMNNEDIITVVIEDEGCTLEKDISLDEFISLYNSEIKSNDCEEFLEMYLPPGGMTIIESAFSYRYSLRTEEYSEYYGIKDDSKYYMDLTFSLDGNTIRSGKVYSYENAFNYLLTKVKLIYEFNEPIGCFGIDDGVKRLIKVVERSPHIETSEEVLYRRIRL